MLNKIALREWTGTQQWTLLRKRSGECFCCFKSETEVFWTANTTKHLGSVVKPTDVYILGHPNIAHLWYVCVVVTPMWSTGETGNTEPTWPETPGLTVVDNELTWECYTEGEKYQVPDHVHIQFIGVSNHNWPDWTSIVWTGNTGKVNGNVVYPSQSWKDAHPEACSFVFVCINVSGTTGSSEPSWPTGCEDVCWEYQDGTVIWRAYFDGGQIEDCGHYDFCRWNKAAVTWIYEVKRLQSWCFFTDYFDGAGDPNGSPLVIGIEYLPTNDCSEESPGSYLYLGYYDPNGGQAFFETQNTNCVKAFINRNSCCGGKAYVWYDPPKVPYIKKSIAFFAGPATSPPPSYEPEPSFPPTGHPSAPPPPDYPCIDCSGVETKETGCYYIGETPCIADVDDCLGLPYGAGSEFYSACCSTGSGPLCTGCYKPASSWHCIETEPNVWTIYAHCILTELGWCV